MLSRYLAALSEENIERFNLHQEIMDLGKLCLELMSKHSASGPNPRKRKSSETASTAIRKKNQQGAANKHSASGSNSRKQKSSETASTAIRKKSQQGAANKQTRERKEATLLPSGKRKQFEEKRRSKRRRVSRKIATKFKGPKTKI